MEGSVTTRLVLTRLVTTRLVQTRLIQTRLITTCLNNNLPANLPAYLHRPAITIILPHFLPNPPDQSHEDVHSIGKFTSLQYDV